MNKENDTKKISLNKEDIKNITNDIMKYSQELNEVINNYIKINNGNGYHRIKALVEVAKQAGVTDEEIIDTIKEFYM